MTTATAPPEYYPHFHGELGVDHWLREAFFPDLQYRGCVVEVGAGTPVCHSLSRHWIMNGWRGICIDPNPHFAALHRAIGNEVWECAVADFEGQAEFYIVGPELGPVPDGRLTQHAYSSLGGRPAYMTYAGVSCITDMNHERITVPVRTLDSILAEAGQPMIDILTIDTEGWELDVLRGFSLQRHQPRFVVIENYAHDPEYMQYMLDRGYSLIRQLDYNYIFTPQTA